MELLVELRSLSGIPGRLPGNRAKKVFKYRDLNKLDLLHTSNTRVSNTSRIRYTEQPSSIWPIQDGQLVGARLMPFKKVIRRY